MKTSEYRAANLFLLLTGCLVVPSCVPGLPSGHFEVDTVRFVPSGKNANSPGPLPGVWINPNTELSLANRTLTSRAPYGVNFDYTDTKRAFTAVELTRIEIAYADGTIDRATEALELPIRMAGSEHEVVNSVSGGRVVRSKVWVLSGEVPDVVTRAAPFTLRIEGRFLEKNGGRKPFTIDQPYEVERQKTVKPAAEVLRDA